MCLEASKVRKRRCKTRNKQTKKIAEKDVEI